MGDTNSGAAFASTVPGAAAAPASTVAKKRARGKARRTSGEGSQRRRESQGQIRGKRFRRRNERERVTLAQERQGGVSESTHTRKAEHGRRWARSPVTSRARRGHARGSTSQGSTPSPVPVPSVQTLGVPASSLQKGRSHIQTPLSAQSKSLQTRSQTRWRTQQSAEQEAVEFMPSSRLSSPVTAPPSAGMIEVHDMPDLFGGATAPSRGETATMQRFFPTTYKKKTTFKKRMTMQQMNYPSTSGFREDEENSDETQQQKEDIIRITASKGVLVWMLSAAEAAKSFLHSFDTAKKKYQQDPQVSFSDLGARPKTSKQRTWYEESPMTSTTPLYMQIPMESPEEELQQPVKTMDWKCLRKALENDKHLFPGSRDLTMPVTYDAQGQNPRWERMSHETLKDLGKAAQTFGLDSQYFKQMLKTTFTMYDLTPYDIRSIVSMVFTDTQNLMWEKRWRRYLTEL